MLGVEALTKAGWFTISSDYIPHNTKFQQSIFVNVDEAQIHVVIVLWPDVLISHVLYETLKHVNICNTLRFVFSESWSKIYKSFK